MSCAFEWSGFLSSFDRAARASGFVPRSLMETAAGPLMVWEQAGVGPWVYVSAGIHGDEPAGPLAMLDLMREGFFAEVGGRWALCPALNPTGLAAGRRERADGIDLNRDYWWRRCEETQAHAAWLERLAAPELFMSLHEDWEENGFYLYEINLGLDEPRRARGILEAVSPWFPPAFNPQIDGHWPREPGWIFHEAKADIPEGWPEAIFLAERGCPLSFTFETPSHAPLAARVAAQCAAVRAAWRLVSTLPTQLQ